MWRRGLAGVVTVLIGTAVVSAQAPIEYRRDRPTAPVPNSPPTAEEPAPEVAPPSTPRAPAPVELRRPERTPFPRPRAAAPVGPDTASPPPGEAPPLSVYALRPEEVHPFDPRTPPTRHQVQNGETLYALAALYQVPLRALIDENRLGPPFALTAGQSIAIPRPRLHQVQAGETLLAVARRYNVDARSLALLNRLERPYQVRPGDSLVLPALARAEPEEPAPTSLAPAAPQRTAPPTAARPSSPAATRLAWPLTGPVLTRFGTQPGGRRSDGLEIAAVPGTSFSAAADGTVVYAGTDLPAYGGLILVRHGDGRVTAYGYADRLQVREGQSVRRGQALGVVGRPPDGQSRLLFQVRRGATALDPMASLGPAPN